MYVVDQGFRARHSHELEAHKPGYPADDLNRQFGQLHLVEKVGIEFCLDFSEAI
jgi:hypothetical protein